MDVAEHELQALYTWVDDVPLSRPKRNIARDFSDGVLLAEVVAHFYPRLVQLHNYSPANGLQQKLYNLHTLNQRVFRRMDFAITKEECEDIAGCKAGAIERVLKLLQTKFTGQDAEYLEQFAGPLSGQDSLEKGSSFHSPPQAQQPSPMAQTYPPKGASTERFRKGSHEVQGTPKQTAGMLQSPTLIRATTIGVPSQHETLGQQSKMMSDLKETNEILESKVRKLEQLVRLKDAKIQTLLAKLQAAGLV